jgi:6-pyruvoyltetrahydropterin/6-carboxytetrahydropterin synthase
MAKWKITKRYGHEQGLSCVFKQWRAPETHCSKLHGYALAFEVCFEGDELDDRNWLISFGDLKPFKKFLEDTFDHKTLVAATDPDLATMLEIEQEGICDVVIVPEVGCEKFAELVCEWLERNLIKLAPRNAGNVRVKYVKVQEHAGNTAIYEPEPEEETMNHPVPDWFEQFIPRSENITASIPLDTTQRFYTFHDLNSPLLFAERITETRG